MHDAIADRRAEWRAAGLYGPDLMTEAMDEAAARYGADKLLFISPSEEREFTLAEINSYGGDMAAALRRRGIGAGDVVAVQLPDIAECAIAYRAALALGAVLVPIPAIYGEKELRFILADSRTRCLITADRWRSLDFAANLPGLMNETGLNLVVVVGNDVPSGCLSWADLANEQRSDTDGPPDLSGVSPQDDVAIVYTSGSTANPKGVRHSHESLLFELRQGNPRWRLDGARWLSVLPFAHMAGFLTVCRHLLFGGPLVTMDRWDPAVALGLIDRFGLTASSLPPFHLSTLLEAAKAAGRSTVPLADCLVGSTAVQATLIREADAVGCWSYRCYGSTEHPTISSTVQHAPLDARADTDGAVVSGVEVRVVDEDDNDVSPATEGHVLSTGPDLFLGYTDEVATAETFTADGFYRTGDIGVLSGGVLTITGRRKEIIIRGGENLSPKEIEDVLATHPNVLEAAVVGAPDPRYGERPWAFVRTRLGGSLTLEEVRRHFVANAIARQKTPEGLTVVADFPRTAAGKIRKADLRQGLVQAKPRSA